MQSKLHKDVSWMATTKSRGQISWGQVVRGLSQVGRTRRVIALPTFIRILLFRYIFSHKNHKEHDVFNFQLPKNYIKTKATGCHFQPQDPHHSTLHPKNQADLGTRRGGTNRVSTVTGAIEGFFSGWQGLMSNHLVSNGFHWGYNL